jgi:hypothetical protein
MCPKDVAKHMRVHEQKIYYHFHKLEKAGIIAVVQREERGGTVAKIYGLVAPSFFVRFSEMKEIDRVPKTVPDFLKPFIINHEMDAMIVVGSPDPHGPERARSRDAYYAIDLSMFLGTFLTKADTCVKLDTEIVVDDLKQNLIVIGGPVINRITRKINEDLPVKFDEKKNIFSKASMKSYFSDDCGIIVGIQNPFNKDKKILVIAGKRYSGTRAAVLAFIRKFGEISKKQFSIVEGVDADSDGIVDDVRILE